MKKIYYIAALAASLVATSCSDVELPGAANDGLQTVGNLTSVIDGRSLTLNWSLPAGNVSKVLIYRDDTQIAELDGSQTTYYMERAQVNQDNVYTVKVMMGDGLVSLGQSLPVRIDYTAPAPEPTPGGGALPAAYLLTANSIDELGDDDEVAAAQWFLDNYAAKGKGMFISMDELNLIDTKKISCLWIQCDRQDGMEPGVKNLPDGLAEPTLHTALHKYLQDGGNLFLTKHATQLTAAIGRIDEKYAPGIYSSGVGGEGGDVWTTNAQIGIGGPDLYDHRFHPIFAGMEMGDPNNYGYENIPLEGPGMREDHNCMWDCNAYGFSGQPNVIVNFEDATSSSVLSTWGHVQDYCCAGIVEFMPNTEFDGRIIAIGLSAYEFNQAGGNSYQHNIEKLTANCIDYLVANGSQGEVLPKAGYLLAANSDDDEIAAADWFCKNYVMKGLGVFVSLSELSVLKTSEVNRLWIQCDRQDGMEPGVQNLPDGLAEASTHTALHKYLQDGGNLLLTKHATQLTTAIGRIDEKYAPGIFSSGVGGEGGDVWTTNAQIGIGGPDLYDHRTHPIFAGMEMGDPNGYGFENIPLEGPGMREDHNCMWDCNAYGFSGQPNVIVNFEDATSSSVLSTWGHVQDYCCAGIVEFQPNSEFDGRIIAIGLSAYEFNQAGGNSYQHNIEKLTANCIDYLK